MYKALCLAGLISLTTSVQAADLTIEVTDIRNDKGVMSLVLFGSEAAYKDNDYKKAEVAFQQKTKEGKMRFIVSNLDEGEYAFVLLHDENQNNKLDTFRNVPKEGYAYSNNKGKFAIPKFENVKFKLGKDNQSQTVKMLYMK